MADEKKNGFLLIRAILFFVSVSVLVYLGTALCLLQLFGISIGLSIKSYFAFCVLCLFSAMFLKIVFKMY